MKTRIALALPSVVALLWLLYGEQTFSTAKIDTDSVIELIQPVSQDLLQMSPLLVLLIIAGYIWRKVCNFLFDDRFELPCRPDDATDIDESLAYLQQVLDIKERGTESDRVFFLSMAIAALTGIFYAISFLIGLSPLSWF